MAAIFYLFAQVAGKYLNLSLMCVNLSTDIFKEFVLAPKLLLIMAL